MQKLIICIAIVIVIIILILLIILIVKLDAEVLVKLAYLSMVFIVDPHVLNDIWLIVIKLNFLICHDPFIASSYIVLIFFIKLVTLKIANI